MCVVWPPEVEKIADTRIFARHDGSKQVLIYQMKVDARAPVAMTLPLPVAAPVREDSLTFVSLEDDKRFFGDLAALAPKPITYEQWRWSATDGPAPKSRPLPVVDIGDFEASFVPAQKDFERLDERFVVPKWFWQHNRQYADWAFVVVQLKFEKRGQTEPHPVGFVFESRCPRLFFPTMHLHGPQVEPSAEFDHALFAQGVSLTGPIPDGLQKLRDINAESSAIHKKITTAEQERNELRRTLLDIKKQQQIRTKSRDAYPPEMIERIESLEANIKQWRRESVGKTHEWTDQADAMAQDWAYGAAPAGRFASYAPLGQRAAKYPDLARYLDVSSRICRLDIRGVADNGDTWVDAEPTAAIAL